MIGNNALTTPKLYTAWTVLSAYQIQ